MQIDTVGLLHLSIGHLLHLGHMALDAPQRKILC
jgi:hypothetical protein